MIRHLFAKSIPDEDCDIRKLFSYNIGVSRIEIINNTRARDWGANKRKSIVFLQKRPLNYDINNENTNTFINVYLQNKNTMKTTQVFGTAPYVKVSGT